MIEQNCSKLTTITLGVEAGNSPKGKCHSGQSFVEKESEQFPVTCSRRCNDQDHELWRLSFLWFGLRELKRSQRDICQRRPTRIRIGWPRFTTGVRAISSLLLVKKSSQGSLSVASSMQHSATINCRELLTMSIVNQTAMR